MNAIIPIDPKHLGHNNGLTLYKSLRKCEKKYGKSSDDCKWAKRNGFQMEGRLDRRKGTYILPDLTNTNSL